MESKFIATLPNSAGEVKGIASLGSQIVVACSNGVYILTYRGEDKPAELEPVVLRNYA